MKIGYLMQEGVPNVWEFPLSGPAAHVRHVIRELGDLGHEVILLAKLDREIYLSKDLDHSSTVTVRSLDQGPFRIFERGIRRTQHDLRLPYAGLFESFRFARACQRELEGVKLLYERMGWMGYGGGIASRWLGIPLVLEVNGDHLNELKLLGIPPRGMQKWLSLLLMRRAVHTAARIVTTGEGWRQQFIRQWKIDPGDTVYVENGSELVGLLSREQLRSFRNVGNRNEPVKIVFIGHFDPWQGLPVLIHSVAEAIQSGLSLELILVGSGPGMEEYVQIVKDLNIQDFVTFTGRLRPEEYAPYLANADIAVSPYCGREEYSGLKLLDYKSAGLPTIASGHSGQPAVLEHGHTGWIVPPCDRDALCEAIRILSLDADNRRAMGREARMEAEKLHGWRHTAQHLERVFNDVLGDHRSR